MIMSRVNWLDSNDQWNVLKLWHFIHHLMSLPHLNYFQTMMTYPMKSLWLFQHLYSYTPRKGYTPQKRRGLFLIGIWNVRERILQNLPRSYNGTGGFHSVLQPSYKAYIQMYGSYVLHCKTKKARPKPKQFTLLEWIKISKAKIQNY